ncbi:MAG: hypothetical protein J3Q66DRAFT_403901 [Benniella sp.]|nr:MAG: hypothetical protein J3Q66DRAFT_403901 [Benniella sp.]
MERIQGYTFTNKSLLMEALTPNVDGRRYSWPDMEYLKFLGDAVLDVVAMDFWCRWDPGHSTIGYRSQLFQILNLTQQDVFADRGKHRGHGGHMILSFNAAIPNLWILSMLSKYTYKHYTYLRVKYPSWFRNPSEIPCPGTQPLRDLASALTMTIDKDAATEIEIEELDPSGSTNTDEGVSSAYAIPRITVCQHDLRYIASVYAKQGRSAEFADMFLECCELLLQIQELGDASPFIVLAPAPSAQLFCISYYMNHTFLGINAIYDEDLGGILPRVGELGFVFRDDSNKSGFDFEFSFKETGTWIDTRIFAIHTTARYQRNDRPITTD